MCERIDEKDTLLSRAQSEMEPSRPKHDDRGEQCGESKRKDSSPENRYPGEPGSEWQSKGGSLPPL